MVHATVAIAAIVVIVAIVAIVAVVDDSCCRGSKPVHNTKVVRPTKQAAGGR